MCSEMNAKYFLLLIGAFYIKNISATMTWLECDLIRFDNPEGGLFTSDVKVKRHNKTTFGISGPVQILEDFSNDWEYEMEIHHSVNGNNQFVKTPYKVPKTKLCDFMDGVFTKSGAAKNLAEASDFPAPSPNESLCKEFKKGNYTVRQFLLSKDIIPKFFSAGYYKVQGVGKRDNLTTMWQLHLKLY